MFAGLLTPTIAVFGSIIAYRQWRTTQNKLKFDLFEKRFAVFDAARTFISSVMTSGKAKEDEMYKFLSGTREARWLLNNDIATYFDEQIWKKAVELQALESVLQDVQRRDDRTTNVQRQGEIKTWLIDQYKVLDEKFSPFLKLRH